jgi:hypothetical protein
MATARQQENRYMTICLASLVWNLLDSPSVESLREFARCGTLPAGGVQERIPYSPAVEQKIEEIRANGGRLIVEVAGGS